MTAVFCANVEVTDLCGLLSSLVCTKCEQCSIVPYCERSCSNCELSIYELSQSSCELSQYSYEL